MLSATKNRALRKKSNHIGGEMIMRVIAPIAAASAVFACVTWVILRYRRQAASILIYPAKN